MINRLTNNPLPPLKNEEKPRNVHARTIIRPICVINLVSKPSHWENKFMYSEATGK